MSSPYYQFGFQQRYAYDWHGGAGGVPPGSRGAVNRALGFSSSLEESGLEPYSLHYPALGIEGDAATPPSIIAQGDWPALRPAGPEPLDPGEGPLGYSLDMGLSDKEKLLGLGAIAAGAYWWFYMRKPKRRPRRRTPARKRKRSRARSARRRR